MKAATELMELFRHDHMTELEQPTPMVFRWKARGFLIECHV